MEVELEFNGTSTDSNAMNCYMSITDGSGGVRLCTNGSKWKLNTVSGTEYADAIPNTTYKIGWGFRGTGHASNIFINNVRVANGISRNNSYKSTLIGSYN